MLGGKQLFAEAAKGGASVTASGAKASVGSKRKGRSPLEEAAGQEAASGSDFSTPSTTSARGKKAAASKATSAKPQAAEATPAGAFNLPIALNGSQAGKILAALDR